MSAVNRDKVGTNGSHPRHDSLHSVPVGGLAHPPKGGGPEEAAAPRARHLYVHLPFCAHRCGYCDFVTVTGRDGEHASYVDALLAEL